MDSSVILMVETNLTLQVVILALLVAAYSLKRRGQFISHGTLMLVAVVLNVISFLLVMGPSLFSLGKNGVIRVPSGLSIVAAGHASLGGIAMALGIWLVASWHFRAPIRNCVRKKRAMLVVFVLWVLALILGILLFILLYILA